MGQKVNPHGLRVGVIKDWDSKWYADGDFADYLVEDYNIRTFLKKKLYAAGVSKIEIERASDRVKVIIYTAKPGVVIGKGGAEIEKIKAEVQKLTDKKLVVDIKEVKRPDRDAQLVAENIALQLENRVSFRRAMKSCMGRAMKTGAKGIKTSCSGRLGGADMARTEFYSEGTIPLQSPDYETRMAILRKKEEMEGYNIDNEVIKYIATNIKSNIRELEGALTKIVALSRLNKCDITLGLAEEALKDIISPNAQREVTPNLIIQVVSDHFGITPLDISSQKRTKEIVYPRQIVMYLCRNMTETPLQSIGRILGGRDHTTIIHGSEKIAADMNKDENLKNTIEILKKKINPQ